MANAQEMSFDTTILVGKERFIYEYRSISIDKENNKYVVGLFKDSTAVDTFHLTTILHNTNEVTKAIFMSKYDSTGRLLSSKKIVESDSCSSFSISMDNSNNLYVTLNFSGKVYFDNDSLFSHGSTDILILKYNSSGVLLFSKLIGGNNGEGLAKESLAFDSQGGFYLTGSFNGTWTNNSPGYFLVIGNDTLFSSTLDIFIAKFDSNGNSLWAKSYGGSGFDVSHAICYDRESLFLIGELGTDNFDGIPVNYHSGYFSRCFLAKLDSNGNGKWVRKFGSNDIQSAGVLPKSITCSQNRVYFTGLAASNSQNVFLFDGGPTLTGFNQVDYFIAAYDTSGTFQWNTISNSLGSEYIVDLHCDSVSNLVGIGKLNYTLRFPTDTLYSSGGDDVMVCSYDSSGNFRWAAQGGGWGADIGNGIAADTHGQLFIVGGTTSPLCLMGNDTLMPPANQSTLFFSALDSIVLHIPNAIHSISKAPLQLIASPNPVDQQLQLQGNETGTCYLYDALGRCLFEQRIAAWPYYLNTAHYPNGIYLLQFQQHDSLLTQKISIQH